MNGKLGKTNELEETVGKMRKLQEGTSGYFSAEPKRFVLGATVSVECHFKFILQYGFLQGCQAEREMHMFMVFLGEDHAFQGHLQNIFFKCFFGDFAPRVSVIRLRLHFTLPLLPATRIQK